MKHKKFILSMMWMVLISIVAGILVTLFSYSVGVVMVIIGIIGVVYIDKNKHEEKK